MTRTLKRIFFAALVVLSLCGFTFDYEVLAECEKRHPNDFITRVACNNVEEERRKELAALPCVDQAVNKLYAQKPALDKLLAENAEAEYQTLISSLKEFGFRPQAVASKNNKPGQNLSTLVHTETTGCNSKAHFLFNIRLNEEQKIEKMLVWVAKYKGDGEIFLPSMTWNKIDNIKDIEDAYTGKANEAVIKETQEKQLKLAIDKETEQSNKTYWTFISNVTVFFTLCLCFALIWWLTKNKASLKVYFKNLSSYSYFRNLTEKENTDSETEQMSSTLGNQSIGPDQTISVQPKQILNNRDESNQKNFSNLIESDGHTGLGIPKNPLSEYEKIHDDSFRSKYTFVNVYVPLQYQIEFLKECEWYKNKVGVYPGIIEQENILAEVSKIS
jgi:hypothetical protein